VVVVIQCTFGYGFYTKFSLYMASPFLVCICLGVALFIRYRQVPCCWWCHAVLCRASFPNACWCSCSVVIFKRKREEAKRLKELQPAVAMVDWRVESKKTGKGNGKGKGKNPRGAPAAPRASRDGPNGSGGAVTRGPTVHAVIEKPLRPRNSHKASVRARRRWAALRAAIPAIAEAARLNDPALSAFQLTEEEERAANRRRAKQLRSPKKRRYGPKFKKKLAKKTMVRCSVVVYCARPKLTLGVVTSAGYLQICHHHHHVPHLQPAVSQPHRHLQRVRCCYRSARRSERQASVLPLGRLLRAGMCVCGCVPAKQALTMARVRATGIHRDV